MTMRLWIPGIPKATQTGSIIRTRDGRAFPSRRGSAWLAYVKSFMAINAPEAPMEGAVEAWITFCMPDLKDMRRIDPTSRPDYDNLLKGLMDQGNGILWRDDSQIVKAHIEKRYARFGDTKTPGVLLEWHEYINPFPASRRVGVRDVRPLCHGNADGSRYAGSNPAGAGSIITGEEA